MRSLLILDYKARDYFLSITYDVLRYCYQLQKLSIRILSIRGSSFLVDFEVPSTLKQIELPNPTCFSLEVHDNHIVDTFLRDLFQELEACYLTMTPCWSGSTKEVMIIYGHDLSAL